MLHRRLLAAIASGRSVNVEVPGIPLPIASYCAMSSSAWDFPSFLGTPSSSCLIPDTFHQPSSEEEVKVQNLVAYFGKEGYDVPGSEKAGLTDWEMMFLVSHLADVSWLELRRTLVQGRNHAVPDR